MKGFCAAIVLAFALSSPSAAAVNLSPGTTLRTGTKIACTLEARIDSSTVTQGTTFTLDVNDPSYPQLRGAVVEGYVTSVTQPHGLTRARIAFLFSKITFANGTSEPLHAYLVGRNMVERQIVTPTAMPPIAPRGVPSPSTIAVQVTIGPQGSNTTPAGGYMYANRNGAPIVIRKGKPLTIELAAGLQTP